MIDDVDCGFVDVMINMVMLPMLVVKTTTISISTTFQR